MILPGRSLSLDPGGIVIVTEEFLLYTSHIIER